jgi:hypothetical protein
MLHLVHYLSPALRLSPADAAYLPSAPYFISAYLDKTEDPLGTYRLSATSGE